MAAWQAFGPAQEYWVDAWQRAVLVLDALRDRGNTYWEHKASPAPNVLDFRAELVCDGRTLPKPVNYLLARIIPPKGAKVDPEKPPFIVVDPRAGHGPGIGGMKQDSEIGVAIAAGHPCYFVGFLPEPVPGQTLEDVCLAQAAFVEAVEARHAEAQGKPVIIANCQAGWQSMIMAAIRPDLAGPIMLAGSPLSYWAGVRGRNPMRYLGGALGGTWLTALAGDLGNGIFDGAYLVENFESLNLANTFWQKPYNLYSKVDTETARFLDFETWWGSPVLLNAEEMLWIADNLFVGDKLTRGALRTSEGLRIDLRNIRSPIIVFCSWGDNITPPQQALGWITDLYGDVSEIAANGQTIVYTLHQTIGHLGIFVSGKVATKEHREFAACMDMIDLMPPGLFEAVITEADEDAANPSLIDGRYLLSLEPRTLDDIRALGGNSPDDDLRFATAARVSEVNVGLYQTLLAPLIRGTITEPVAKAIRDMHPNRLRFSVFSDRNPLMQPVGPMALAVRNDRQPASTDNPFLVFESAMSSWISMCLDTIGRTRDTLSEALFLTTYGSPFLQALTGLGRPDSTAGRRIERDLVREADEARLYFDLERRFEVGEPVEAALRALFHVLRAEARFDERQFAVLKLLRAAQPPERRRTVGELKALLREQSLLMHLDEERAIRAIPKLLPPSVEQRRALLEALGAVVRARGVLSEKGKRRFDRICTLFDVKVEKPAKSRIEHA